MDPGFLERTVEVTLIIIEAVLNNVLLEQEIVEELCLDDEEDELGDEVEDEVNVGDEVEDEVVGDEVEDEVVGDEVEDEVNALNVAHNTVINIIEVLLEDFQHWDDEDEIFLEDDREVLDREFQRVIIRRFYQLEDVQFKRHFRMSRGVFEVLVTEFAEHLTAQNRLHRIRTGLDVCLLMSLWVLGNLSSFREIAEVFGVCKSTVHYHYVITIDALRELRSKFIKWPTALQRARMKEHIRRTTGFPGVTGMMDGMLVTVTAPAVQKERYFDRHHQYSYNVMLVCDNNLLVTFAYVGEVGSAHDSRVFKRSGLHDILLERRDFLADDEHILADGAYALTNRVLVPYRNNGRLTQRQKHFNKKLSGKRVRIEHTNGRVKTKWRRLFRLHVRNADYALDHLMACAVLHNFVLLEGRERDGMSVDGAVQHDAPGNVVAMEHPLLAAARAAGVQKRNEIAALLHPGD